MEPCPLFCRTEIGERNSAWVQETSGAELLLNCERCNRQFGKMVRGKSDANNQFPFHVIVQHPPKVTSGPAKRM